MATVDERAISLLVSLCRNDIKKCSPVLICVTSPRYSAVMYFKHERSHTVSIGHTRSPYAIQAILAPIWLSRLCMLKFGAAPA